MTVETLMERRAALQSEQQQTAADLAEMRSRLPELTEERRRLLRRYDTGVDEAGPAADVVLREIEATESAIARAERRQAEYGDRIHQLNQEIERTKHRETLHKLLDMRRLEVEAFNALEQVTVDFLDTWHAFLEARSARAMLARQAHVTAVNLGLPQIADGSFPAPTTVDVTAWLNDKHGNRAIEQATERFARCRAAIPEI